MSQWHDGDCPWPQPIPLRHARRRPRRDWSTVVAWALITFAMGYLAWHTYAAHAAGRFGA